MPVDLVALEYDEKNFPSSLSGDKRALPVNTEICCCTTELQRGTEDGDVLLLCVLRKGRSYGTRKVLGWSSTSPRALSRDSFMKALGGDDGIQERAWLPESPRPLSTHWLRDTQSGANISTGWEDGTTTRFAR